MSSRPVATAPGRCRIVRAVVLSILAGLSFVGVGASAAAPAESPRSVSREEIPAAMRRSGGYDLCATANAPRLQADVLRQLIREAQASDPDGHAKKGVPGARPDLRALAVGLEEPLETRFRPMDGAD